tara:strand:+ start:596 stop:1105 length:510 start_codon:yes stop_codon:yes gene_type:complete
MKKSLFLLFVALSTSLNGPIKAEFGDADFPAGMFNDGPKSYHDAWCRKIKNKCRIRIQGQALWVEGQGGIYRSQFLQYRFDSDGGELYNYITYKNKKGQKRDALFLFANRKAQGEFIRAFIRWKDQKPQPIPNYRFPNSQGPQDTQGRDKGLNPYDNDPIMDWSEKTTD